MKTGPAHDSVDEVLAQWRRECPDLDLEGLGILARLLRLGVHLDQRVEAVAEGSGISRGLLDVLLALRRAGPPYQLSPTDLFNKLLVTSGCMTHRLDRLEAEGLVARIRDPDDRRGIKVELTDKGMRLTDAIVPQLSQILGKLLNGFDANQRKQFAEDLRRLLAAAENKPRSG